MELFRSTEFGEVRCFKHAILGRTSWVLVRLSPGVEFNLLWHFLIFNNTLSLIVGERARIKIKGDSESGGAGNLDWLLFVELSHALNFTEHNVVTFLEDMSLIFMNGDSSLLSLFNHGDDETLGLLSIVISDDVFVSKVDEAISPWSECLRGDVSNVLCSALSIEFLLVKDGSINEHFSLTHNVCIT